MLKIKRYVTEFANDMIATEEEGLRMALALMSKEQIEAGMALRMNDLVENRIKRIKSIVEQCKYGYVSEIVAVKQIVSAVE